MRGTSAVIGVGESRYYKAGAASESEFQLLCTAIKNAAADAGLDLIATAGHGAASVGYIDWSARRRSARWSGWAMAMSSWARSRSLLPKRRATPYSLMT